MLTFHIAKAISREKAHFSRYILVYSTTLFSTVEYKYIVGTTGNKAEGFTGLWVLCHMSREPSFVPKKTKNWPLLQPQFLRESLSLRAPKVLDAFQTVRKAEH